MVQEGKPPERVKKEDFQGAIDDDDRGGRYRKPTNNAGMMQYVTMAVISLVVSFAMLNLMGVSKSDFDTKYQSLVSSVSASQADIKSSQSVLGNAVVNLPSTITTQVNTAITSITSRLSTIESSVQNFTNQISANTKSISDMNTALTKGDTDIIAKLDALQAKLTTDEAKIKALEDKLITPVGVSSNITSEVVRQNNLTLVPLTTDNLTTLIRLKFINNSNKDAIVDVTASIDFDKSIKYTTVSSEWGENFHDNWGLSLYKDSVRIKANTSISLNLIFTLNGVTEYSSGNVGIGYLVTCVTDS